MLWYGDESCQWKGLAVIWKNRLSVYIARPLTVHSNKIPYTLPLVKDKRSYPQLLMDTLKQNHFYLSRFDSIVIGDLNCYMGQQVSKGSVTFSDCIKYLADHGLRSAYHELTGEAFGKESKATYYHQYQADQPMMLDYAFTTVKPKSFQIGEWNSEFSDHCPLMLELEEEDWDGNP